MPLKFTSSVVGVETSCGKEFSHEGGIIGIACRAQFAKSFVVLRHLRDRREKSPRRRGCRRTKERETDSKPPSSDASHMECLHDGIQTRPRRRRSHAVWCIEDLSLQATGRSPEGPWKSCPGIPVGLASLTRSPYYWQVGDPGAKVRWLCVERCREEDVAAHYCLLTAAVLFCVPVRRSCEGCDCDKCSSRNQRKAHAGGISAWLARFRQEVRGSQPDYRLHLIINTARCRI